MEATCISICSNGTQCSKRRKIVGDGLRCGVHHNALLNYGPHTTARRELGYIHKKEIAEFNKNYNDIVRQEVERGTNRNAMWILNENHKADMGVIVSRHIRIMAELVGRQLEEVRITGIDPDIQARERDRARRNDLLNRQRIRRNQLMLQQQQRLIMLHRQVMPPLVPADDMPHLVPAEDVRPLERFAADPQNVHTTDTVRQTKEIVERVRTIPVPEDYKWNTRVVSKTIGEIIAECQLTSHAAAQMFNQYVSNVAVYDIEEGIYGKVLDSVWQYIKTSPDKEDLCKILKNEMTDNIGMCAQGNLSRICNILAGYLDGVGEQECLSERLGRLLSSVMSIESIIERVEKACNILKENNVPMDEWEVWMDPVLEDNSLEIYENVKQTLAV